MKSVPEENNQSLNDGNGNDGDDDGKYIFSTLDVFESFGFVVFEVAGLALHDAEYHVAGFVFNFLGAWCGLLVLRHKMQHSKFKKNASASYWSLLVLGFLFFAFLAWSVASKNPAQSTDHVFSITANSLNEPGKEFDYYLIWNVQMGTEKEAAFRSPINQAMAAQLFNLKDYPLKILSYQFEGMTGNGKWEVMPVIDPRFGYIAMVDRKGNYAGVCDLQSMGIAIDNFFPENFAGKTIDRNHQINGYLFLESPELQIAGKIRLRIKTPQGEYVEPIDFQSSTNGLHEKIQVGLAGLVYMKFPFDINQIPIKPYSEQLTNRFGIGGF